MSYDFIGQMLVVYMNGGPGPLFLPFFRFLISVFFLLNIEHL